MMHGNVDDSRAALERAAAERTTVVPDPRAAERAALVSAAAQRLLELCGGGQRQGQRR